MAGLTGRDAELLRKIAGQGGDRRPVALSSVAAEGDQRTQEALARLQRGGYVRVQTPKSSAVSMDGELDALSQEYLNAVRALARGGGREGLNRAAEVWRRLSCALRRAETESARLRGRLEATRRELDEARSRARAGRRSGADRRAALSREMGRLEASLAFLEALPGPGGARRGGVLAQLDLLAEELVARRRVGELSQQEYRRRLDALDRRRQRLRERAAGNPVERRVDAAREALARLRRAGRLTAAQARELSVGGGPPG